MRLLKGVSPLFQILRLINFPFEFIGLFVTLIDCSKLFAGFFAQESVSHNARMVAVIYQPFSHLRCFRLEQLDFRIPSGEVNEFSFGA